MYEIATRWVAPGLGVTALATALLAGAAYAGHAGAAAPSYGEMFVASAPGSAALSTSSSTATNSVGEALDTLGRKQ